MNSHAIFPSESSVAARRSYDSNPCPTPSLSEQDQFLSVNDSGLRSVVRMIASKGKEPEVVPLYEASMKHRASSVSSRTVAGFADT